MNARDAYTLLGLTPPVTLDVLRKTYRKLGGAVHPDKNKSEEAKILSAELGLAYSILKELALKSQADGLGEEPTPYQAPPDWMNSHGEREDKREAPIEHDFKHWADDQGRSAHEDRASAQAPREVEPEDTETGRGQDIRRDVHISLAVAANGGPVSVTGQVTDICPHCQGTRQSSEEIVCLQCGGSGRYRKYGDYTTTGPICGGCNGSGWKRKPCAHCEGRGKAKAPRTYKCSVSIPAGVKQGSTLRCKGFGQKGVSQDLNGDLLLRIHVDDSDYLHLDKHGTLTLSLPINPLRWMVGGEEQMHILGRDVQISLPPRFACLEIPGEGYSTTRGARGVLRIIPKVVYPESIPSDLLPLVRAVGSALQCDEEIKARKAFRSSTRNQERGDENQGQAPLDL